MINFEFVSPTKIFFGKGQEENVGKIIKKYGFKTTTLPQGGWGLSPPGRLGSVPTREAGVCPHREAGVCPHYFALTGSRTVRKTWLVLARARTETVVAGWITRSLRPTNQYGQATPVSSRIAAAPELSFRHTRPRRRAAPELRTCFCFFA